MSEGGPPLLEVAGLRTHFLTRAGVVKAVDDVSFTVRKGEVMGLVGESGSGKSMTGYSIMGLIDPPGRIVDGTIRLNGRDLRTLSSEDLRQLRGNRIAMIFQDPMMTLNPVLSVAAQMIETIQAHGSATRQQALARSRAALVKVGIPSPDERLAAYPHQFSGGMRQRVAIAIALLNNPDLIIADEPTTALDVTIQGQILFEMQKLTRETGAAMIWITHDLSVVAGLADRVCVMYAGRIVEQGTVFDVLTHPRHPYTQGLLDSVPSRSARGARLRQIPGMPPSVLDLPEGCAFRERCSRATEVCATTPAMLPAAGIANGQSARCHHPLGPPSGIMSATEHADRVSGRETGHADAASTRVPLVELSQVSKRFVKSLDAAAKIGNLLGAGLREEVVHAVDGVDLAIFEGEVVGLVGESGCGKSTLGRLAVGLLPLTRGRRSFRGQPLEGLAPDAARRQQLKMQMIFQDPYASLNPRMRVVDIVGEAPVAHGLAARGAQGEYVAQQLNRVGLDASLMRRFPHQFSGGQRARIGIARALAVAPEFLVCDESVAALDVSIQAQVLNLFMELRSALNLTYLFISHDLGVVEHISDRVVIMYLGRVVESGPTAELYASPNHPYTQALLTEVGKVEPRKRTFVPIKGEIPSPLAPPSGCHFHPRCPHSMPVCRTTQPALKEIAPGRLSACHLNDVAA